MNVPRAIVGSIQCMARPRRPVAELIAVREAAEIVRSETSLTSSKAVAREISSRVVTVMLEDIDQDDPLIAVLAALEHQYAKSPIHDLATCPEINTVEAFVQRREARLRARSGRYLSQLGQAREREEISNELRELLAQRYDRQIRDERSG